MLKQRLIDIARSEDVVDVISPEHGIKDVVDGSIEAPYGGSIKLRTIWIIDRSQVCPRFVTAYPL